MDENIKGWHCHCQRKYLRKESEQICPKCGIEKPIKEDAILEYLNSKDLEPLKNWFAKRSMERILNRE